MKTSDRYDCDIVIPVFNKPEITISCLESIEKNTRSPHRIIIIDNGSDPATEKALAGFKSRRENVSIVRSGENLGWVKAVNRGIGLSNAPYVCIMNNDTVVETPDWLEKMIRIANAVPDAGLLNPEFGDEKKPKSRVPSGSSSFVEIDFCRGYCILIKRAVIDKIGGLDETYGLGYYDDDDYSVRAIRAGFRCIRANGIIVRHLRDTTFSAIFPDDKRRALHQKNKELFYSRWGKRLRLVFIISKPLGRDKVSAVLLRMARKQHIVYVWNMASPLGLEHINIRERRMSAALSSLRCAALLTLNGMKKDPKRYNAVFVDDEGIFASIRPVAKGPSYCVDMERDGELIESAVDSAARA